MKRILLSIVTITAFTFASCGSETDEKKEVSLEDQMCECFGTMVEMRKEMMACEGDSDMMLEVKLKYEKDGEACEEIGEKLEATLKEGEDKRSKMDEMSKTCPAIDEFKDL